MDSDDEHDGFESEAKRRRLRKGTHSCWACKRRKVRCTFASETDGTCITCRRRGTRCISQELPEDLSQIEDSADRIVRVEALLNQLVNKVDPSSATKDQDGAQSTSEDGRRLQIATPTLTSDSGPSPFLSLNEPSQERLPTRNEDADTSTHHSTSVFRTPDLQTPTHARAAPPAAGKHEKISQALLAAFPSEEDVDILLRTCNRNKMFCHQVNVKARSQLDREGFHDEIKLAEIRSPRTHPVLLAKQMLLLSLTLLHLSPDQHIRGLSEQYPVIMERLADTAISLVTTREELFGTVESLECILLEAFYHLDNGSIRRAWVAFRRAMVAAQLMGIHRPSKSPVKIIDPSTNADPQILWFRIIYMDRFLSLLLGLPQGNSNVSMWSDTTLANGAPSERLECLHAVILAKMLERNELGPSQSVYDVTLDIDTELLKAAEGLPAKFWGPPNFAGLEKDSPEAFWECIRVRDQMFHYTILNQLHLPLLLCPDAERKHEYSKVTCVTSSREILTRFVAYRTFNRIPTNCRLADFMALVAGITLILAHLYSHRNKETGNLLAHQRLGDRATVEQALENMEVSSKLNEDMLAARCARLLQDLLAVEAGASQGRAESYHEDERALLFITVPYFGTIRIAREGISSMETPMMSPRHTQDLGGNVTIGGIGSVRVANHCGQPSANVPVGFVDHIDLGNLSPLSHHRPTQTQMGELHTASANGRLPSAVVGDEFMQQQDLYPSVVAGMNDWVFQGIDTAFFDNLMRGTSVQVSDGGGGAEWTQTWPSDLSR